MAWGEVDSWDDVKLKDLGKLLEGFDKKDISMLIDDTVKVSNLVFYIRQCYTDIRLLYIRN
jgi:hypothetical protein